LKYKQVKKEIEIKREGWSSCFDPVVLCFSGHDLDPKLRQRRALSIEHSYREFFEHFISKVEKELIQTFEMKNSEDDIDYNAITMPFRRRDQNHMPWQTILAEAVRNGEPADFSNESMNRIYAVQKLETRTRYLHHLIMDFNIISNRVRALLVDRLNSVGDKRDFSIVSIGGGPGYDHVAFWAVLLFIRSMNHNNSMEDVRLRTRVFDLYKEWEPIISEVDKAVMNTSASLETSEIGGNVSTLMSSDLLSLHLCDIRLDLCADINAELYEAIDNVDIIVFQFVMHENASIILSEDEIKGATLDILKKSRLGTIMICTDSQHFVWPNLKTAAKLHGWEFYSNLERKINISFGPKQFVLLQRTHRNS